MNISNPNSVPKATSGVVGSLTAILAITGIWLGFAWPWLTGIYTIPWDGKAHFAPQIQFMATSFSRGEMPWWTPNVFAGHPQIADPQSMIFSPPFLLLALLGPGTSPWAIDFVVHLMVLASALAVFALTRQYGWHRAGGLIAAVGFAFGAAMAWRLQHFGQVLSLAYLPFALIFLRRAILSGDLASGVLAGLFAAFIVLGRDQVGLLSVYVLAGYGIALIASSNAIWSGIRRTFAPLLSGAVVAGMVVAVPIILTLLLAEQSNRPAIGYEDAAAGSLHPALLLTGAVPHLYGAAGEMEAYWGPPSFVWNGTGLYLAQNMGLVYLGALPLLLLIIGAMRGYLWERGIAFFTVAWVLLLLYALGWYTPVFRVLYDYLPGVSFYRRPADAVFLVGGIGALLAGYVAHRLMQDVERGRAIKSRTLLIAAGIGCFFLIVAAALALHFGTIERAAPGLASALGWLALAVSALAGTIWLAPIRPLAAAMLLVGVTAGDVIVNNGPNGASALPSEDLAMLEPGGHDQTIAKLHQLVEKTRSDQRRDRIEIVGLGYHWPNVALTHNLHSTLGANPVRLQDYVAATGAGDTVGLGGQRHFPPLFPHYGSVLADLLGLRYIVTQAPIEQIDKALPAGALRLIARTPEARIYENPDALPRVLFATLAQRADFTAILKTGRWPVSDFRSTVLFEDAAAPEAARRPGMIAIKAYRNTSVTLEVDSPDGGWAVLNDVWHPWWQGEVDGRPVPVLKANVLFRAIHVPPGRHTVRFIFRPLSGALTQ
ncbi:MAG: YfhO family protein, partial [Alphaproteobacteria bacterium]|nr:YfhO family protein [Alphaproteobacteria bacterium]